MKQTKQSKNKVRGEKLGTCLICGKRVKTDHSYITAVEGYAHRTCLSERKMIA